MSKNIVIVDYGAGNIGSVINMIKRVGGVATASGDLDELSAADKLILPGIGSFDNAVKKLDALGLVDLLRERASAGVPLLGICLGMQLLGDESEEGKLPGLGLIPGKVRKLTFGDELGLKVPHMGWNQVVERKPHPLTVGLEPDSRFYFVHSYHFNCADPDDELLVTKYVGEFTSGIQRENVMGVQFHPEKSHRFGVQLFQNFVGV